MPELDEGTKTNVNSGDEVHKGRGKPLKVKARRGGYYGSRGQRVPPVERDQAL